MFDFQTTFTMGMNRKVFGITFPNYNIFRCEIWLIISTSFMMLVSLSDAVTLTGSSEYAVLGTEFTLTCDVPEEATLVTFYRRPDVTLPVGSIQVGRGGGQCYNRNGLCTANVCSCVTSGGSLATVFRWIIQPQTGDQGSVWYCRHSNWFNPILPEQRLYSDDYTLILADGPGTSLALSPANTTYTRTEGDTLPDITCTADCRPDCTFVWTRPDNTNFTVSPVLSLGQLDRSEHGTYICTARNDIGESIISTEVALDYGPSASLALSPPDTTYTRTEGDTLPDITCTADCRPDCTFVWTRPDNTNFTVSPVLSLGQLDRSEHGTYRCTARNVVGESISFFSVFVTYGPSTVSLTPSTVTYTPTEGQSIPTITCSADCNPDCTYSWTKDGQSYTTGSGLQLTNIQRGQTGVYRCTASNLHGSTTAVDVSVMVYHSPSIRNLKSTLDSNLREGGSTSLVCTVESVPASTIQWFYGDNVTVLLESSDVLESIYTLTNAGCMDTGLYTCSVRNSVSTTAVTRDIPINVLCKPRADPRVNIHHNVGLAISESLTLTALFLANPEPSFTWTFREGRGTHLSKLVDGEDNFVSQNSFQLNSLTAMSIGTRTHIQEQWFGTYDVTATNSEGSELISFTVVPQGRPVRPYHAIVACVSENRAFLSWRSEFNGGSTQTFVIGIKSEAHNSFVLNRTLDTPDPGQHKASFVFISGLSAGTQYFFNVYAVNKYGNSTLKRDVNCTTDSVKYVRFNNNGLHAASIALIVILVVLMLIGVMAVFTRKGRRWCRQFQLRKQDCQDAQISERAGGALPRDTGRSQNPQTDGNDVAMDTIYTDISRHRQGAENVSGHSDGQYEPLQTRSGSNVYEDLRGSKPDMYRVNKKDRTYVNVEL